MQGQIKSGQRYKQYSELINVGQHGSAAAASKFDKFRWRILHWSSVCGASQDI